MNRLVREHYPVPKLPEDLREGLDGREDVTVTIEATEPAPGETEVRRPTPKSSLFSQFKHLRQENFKSDQEVDDYVAALRDG